MKVGLFYDGQFIKWNDKSLVIKASSGLPGHQIPGEQCMPDTGPVPEGLYKVYIADHGLAKDDGRGICALKPSWGIQEIPRGIKAGPCEPYWANWGKNRARMEPADEATKRHCAPITRGGFYLHDSVKGFSHGCIEVETTFFNIYANIIPPQRNKQYSFKLNISQTGRHMAALRNSIFIVFLLYSCANSAQTNNVVINNHIEGCFTFTNWQLNTSVEPVILHASVGPGNKNMGCPCKSALIKYSVNQINENDISNLLSGVFTTLGKDVVELPIVVQKQLIFNKIPIQISMSCANP